MYQPTEGTIQFLESYQNENNLAYLSNDKKRNNSTMYYHNYLGVCPQVCFFKKKKLN